MLQSKALSLPTGLENGWDSFEKLVQTHERALYNFAYRLTGDPEEAKDLTQEAFYRAYKNYDKFTPGTCFDRWVYRIIHNLYLDHVRKNRKIRQESLDNPIRTSEGDITRELADNSAGPVEDYESLEFQGVLAKALKTLSPEFRAAIILCDVQGFSYEEISHILNCSIGTVRSRIHRGRRQLRELLQPYLASSSERR
ncbi:MAG TPA: RNA polymerase subunit sigma-24 [Firmicutes bacterium]|jgi:RNA polymerase sigma-70 factor (ECF subfamily)|nr:RNA polymerase subunit sigma-24 [Bacillota bacterium]HAW70263.1 RNA polymerase subunit sigma-24 [Bacillota bacterium]HAZ22363.1 RNA polymerase subunit sigma-24 [Bacillota bacterium]HBE07363.1 RNA polymerase subunit sigma-24 [Bacillota bacterium]HBG44681.1 RNA polymerase subunit sigma-24 [Bacillota bacterium]